MSLVIATLLAAVSMEGRPLHDPFSGAQEALVSHRIFSFGLTPQLYQEQQVMLGECMTMGAMALMCPSRGKVWHGDWYWNVYNALHQSEVYLTLAWEGDRDTDPRVIISAVAPTYRLTGDDDLVLEVWEGSPGHFTTMLTPYRPSPYFSRVPNGERRYVKRATIMRVEDPVVLARLRYFANPTTYPYVRCPTEP